jgi:hypothetical protein
MTISSGRMFRVLLLIVCMSLWMTALPAFARGIVGPAFRRDLVTAGSLCVGVVFHTLSLVMLSPMLERAGRSWP